MALETPTRSDGMQFVAVTVPINSPSEPLRLTKNQVYEGLKIKARDGSKFISVIESCEVVSESETGLLRKVQFIGAPGPVFEQIEYFPAGLVDFKMLPPEGSGLTQPVAYITNLITSTGTGSDSELFLTFTFAFLPPGPLDAGAQGPGGVRTDSEREILVRENIEHTINVIREFVKNGEIQ